MSIETSPPSCSHRFEAALARIVFTLIRPLGITAASNLGGFLGRTIGPRVGVTRRARLNLERTLPELDGPTRDQIVRDMWENFGRTLFEYPLLDKFILPKNASRLNIVGLEHLTSVAAAGRGGLIVSGHFANWEILPLIAHLQGIESGAVYRSANNQLIDNQILALRAKVSDAVQIPKGAKGARSILRLLKSKKFVMMLIDQKLNDGIEATLFGQKAMTTSAPAGLAYRNQVPIVPVSLVRSNGTCFTLTVHKPIETDSKAEALGEITRVTQELNDFLEARIREHPSQWFWLHDRWSFTKKG
ncbi:MAG: KDO2-lipid IV(A) lauroyltransferase [Parvibaculaceae bacterium]